MANYSIPYGKKLQSFDLPDGLEVDVILPPDTLSLAKEAVVPLIQQALNQPLGGKSLAAFRGARSVAIAVNDKTRPVPYDLLLPPLLAKLAELGIPSASICLYIATGTHLPMPPEEFSRILPQSVIDHYRIVSHNCDDEANLVQVGVTSRGTEILVNRAFYESDLKIVTGNIEPHHFAGFSGGAKTASIGLCGRKTINFNHAMLIDPNSMIGMYEQNPLRQDIEEIGLALKLDFALNFLLSGEHEVADVLFGEPRLVMQQGIPSARRISQTPVKGSYDLVIASAGGHPKDINLYQAQKAMTHASLLCRQGGTILLVAACPEGSGSASYEAYVQRMSSHEEVLARFPQDGFRVGPHKSFQIARLATQFKIVLVSTMPADLVARLLLASASTTQAALADVLPALPPHPRVAIMPHATSTIPIPL